eukprot:g2829.t1
MATSSGASSGDKKKEKVWVPLESNPVAVNKYMKGLGYAEEEFQWEELLSCEEWAQGMISEPRIAVMLNFPITEAVRADEAKERECVEADGQELDDSIFFTKQTVGNACGTIGIIHAVLNNQERMSVGGWFEEFSSSSKDKAPAERAQILESSDELDDRHADSAADTSNSSSEDANLNNHFITFIHNNGCLIELDGRKPWPVNHGATTQTSLLQDACKLIQERFFARDQGGAFALMVLAKSRT